MTSLRYILERIIHALPVLLGVTIFVFFAIQLVPGDPIRIMMHGRVSDQEVQAIYERLGMNRPLLIQYLDFLRKAVTGDLGQSIIQNAPVTALILEKVWLWLGWFPIAGFGEGAGGHLRHMFLPGLTVALFLAPILVQSLRSSMLDVLAAEYIEVARAKGLSEW